MKTPTVRRLVKIANTLNVSSGRTNIIDVVFWGVTTYVASIKKIGRTPAEMAAMIPPSTMHS
jgi:hypothetical protein